MKHTRATAVLLAASAAFVIGTGSAAHAEEPPANVPLIGALPDLGDMALGDAAPKMDEATKQLDGKGLGLFKLPVLGDLLGLGK
jgi:hypothetical protein